MTEITFTYKPRQYQADLEKAMLVDGYKRAILVWHRRTGKDIACLNFMAYKALTEVGTYYYFLPTFRQARMVIWDGIDEQGRRLIEKAFPKDCIDGKPRQDEMKIRLTNGSMFKLVGTDNYDAIAGTNITGCVFSEFSLQDPNCYNLIVSPILRKNGGWAIFNGTPRGRNHLYDMWNMAQENPKTWYSSLLTVADTGLITPEQIEQERKEGRSEEFIQQEFYCSFNRGIEGAYYGKLMDQMQREGRVGEVPWDPSLPVYTFWDIGWRDANVVIFAQFSKGFGPVRIIDYHESKGESLYSDIQVVHSKPYKYAEHWAPHDIRKTEKGPGTTLWQAAKDLGLHFEIVLNPQDNAPPGIQYGIEQVRAILPRVYIDAVKGNRLIKSLEAYRKKFNDVMQCYSETPVHDWASNAADAMRMLAVAIKLRRGEGMTPEQLREMRDRVRARQ